MSLKEIKLQDSDYIIRDDGEEEFEVGRNSVHWFSKKKLLHPELDDIKQELIHWYCPQCEQRQGTQIKKRRNFFFRRKNKK